MVTILYKGIEYSGKYSCIIYANLENIGYINYNNISELNKCVDSLDYEYVRFTSKDFSFYMHKSRIYSMSVEGDTFDLKWDKNEDHINMIESDDNEGILEFI